MALALLVFGPAAAAQAGPPARGLSQTQIDELAQKHDGYYGALAPENLAKPRPKPPFNMTGTWFIDLRKSFSDFMFGPPYPQFYAAGQAAMAAAAVAAKAHKPFRDSIGECYPAGMPMIMTRVWPINIIQLPTVIEMVFGFTNSLRQIYLDGRAHTDPDIAVSTYNGESIGHWEGDTLVVNTKYFEPQQHWIDSGLPISDQFEITERMRLLDHGKTLQIEYIMTDPKNWKGEWRSTKRWTREDYSDIPEVECLPNLNQNLPGTADYQGTAQKGTAQKRAAGTK
ncbi:MAG: hypothetical protein ACREU2_02350 [Steroidobacteraceae bacterium]